MKRLLMFLLVLASLNDVIAQSPELFSFQSVIRGSDEKLLANQDVTLRFSINQFDSLGTTVFSELHYLRTNSNGLMTARIGEGQFVSGDMSSIQWGNGPYFAHYEVDYDGQEDWDISAYTQMMSVPYSLYAKYLEGGADQDTTNEIQFITISNDTLILSSGGTVSLANYLDNTDDQVLSISNDTISLEDGGLVVLPPLPPEVDLDSTNEIQSVSISNDSLFISGSNAVSLTDYLDNTDDQALTLSGDTLFLEDGGSVVLPYDVDSLFTDELQQVQVTGLGVIKNLAITNGNNIQFSVADIDNDSTNELQTLTFSNDTLKLSEGGEVIIPSSQVWNDSNSNINTTKSVGIGTTSPDTNASLELASKPFLPPRLSTTEMLDIENPVDGMMVFNLDKGCPYYYFDDAWLNGCGGSGNGNGSWSGTSGSNGNFPNDPTVNVLSNATLGGTTKILALAGNAAGDVFMLYQGSAIVGNNYAAASYGLMKYNPSQDSVLWDSAFSYTESGQILIDDQGNILVLRSVSSSNLELFKLSPNLSLLWNESLSNGLPVAWNSYAHICADSSGSIFGLILYSGTLTINATNFNAGNNKKLCLFKLNTNGVLQWSRNGEGFHARLAFDPVLNQVYCGVERSNMVGFGNTNGWAYTVYTINSQTGVNISETDFGDVANGGVGDLAGYDGFILGYKSDYAGNYNPYAPLNNTGLTRRNFLKKGNITVRIYAERGADYSDIRQIEVDDDGFIYVRGLSVNSNLRAGTVKMENSSYMEGLNSANGVGLEYIIKFDENLTNVDAIGINSPSASSHAEIAVISIAEGTSDLLVGGNVTTTGSGTIKFGGILKTFYPTVKHFIWRLK